MLKQNIPEFLASVAMAVMLLVGYAMRGQMPWPTHYPTPRARVEPRFLLELENGRGTLRVGNHGEVSGLKQGKLGETDFYRPAVGDSTSQARQWPGGRILEAAFLRFGGGTRVQLRTCQSGRRDQACPGKLADLRLPRDAVRSQAGRPGPLPLKGPRPERKHIPSPSRLSRRWARGRGPGGGPGREPG